MSIYINGKKVAGIGESAYESAIKGGFIGTEAQFYQVLNKKGDMSQLVYDTNLNGIVDDSEKLGGKSASLYALSTDVDAKINSKLTSVYRPQGSVLFANLPELTADKEGYVYNVSDAFTSDERFLGDIQQYPAGTNVVVVNADGVYKFSSLAGVFDMSNFMEKSVYDTTKKEQDVFTYVDKKISSIPSGGGKRTVRFVIGTSTNGWTTADCDYLCDGTDDQEEINSAIQALSEGGGEIKILDGDYIITSSIVINKEGVRLAGCGYSSVLNHKISDVSKPTISVESNYCSVEKMNIVNKIASNDLRIGISASENITDISISENFLKELQIKSSAENTCISKNFLNGKYFQAFAGILCIKKGIISENFVENCGVAIAIGTSTYSIVQKNHTINTAWGGISVNGAKLCIVAENIVEKSKGNYGISFYNATECVCAHNILNDINSTNSVLAIGTRCIVCGNLTKGKAINTGGSGNIVDNNLF